jgi:hypothetical protein
MNTISKLNSLIWRIHIFKVAKTKWSLFIFCTLINGYLLSQHDLWQDELQSLSIARDYESLSNLIELNSKEGRFLLWTLILIPLQGLSSDILLMKSLVFIFNCFSFFVLTRIMPFTTRSTFLVLLSFPVLFGLTVHVRDYAIMLSFSLAYYACWKSLRFRKYRLVPIILLILIGGVAFFIALAFLARDLWISLAGYPNVKPYNRKDWAPTVGTIFFFTFSLFISRPPSSRVSFSPILEEPLQIFIGLARAIQNIAFFGQTHISQPEILGNWFRPIFSMYTVLSLFVIFYVLFNVSGANRIGLLTYSFLYIGYSGFVYPGSWWSHSIFYVVALIMLAFEKEKEGVNRNLVTHRGIDNVIVFLSFIGVATSILGIGRAFFAESSFSNSSKASNLIREICNSECKVAIEQDITGQSISTYLDTPVFYLNRMEYGSYTDWDSWSTSQAVDVKKQLDALIQEEIDVLVLTNPDSNLISNPSFRVVARFGIEDSWAGESYIILLKK